MQRKDLYCFNFGRYSHSASWYPWEWYFAWDLLGSEPCRRYRLSIGPIAFKFEKY